jgi:DNA polymerase iota
MFMFSLKDSVDVLVDRLLNQTLIPLFRQLHPDKKGWNLSLINVAATNMADAASEKGGVGRDISKMFKRQDEVLKQWKVEEAPVVAESENAAAEPEETTMEDVQPTGEPQEFLERAGSEDVPTLSQENDDRVVVDHWESEDEDMVEDDSFRCGECGAMMPTFAMGAHYRWHAQN